MKPEHFPGVRLADFFPQQEVAEHEVLLSFNNDSDGIAFREWWEEKGSAAFNAWARKRADARRADG